MYIVVAEKASVARAIKKALRGQPVVVESVSGHVMGLDFDKKYNDWRRTNPLELFSVTPRWVVKDWKSYRRLMNLFNKFYAKRPILVIATDNDHEGELIGYEVLNIARRVFGRNVPYKRMRFNSTKESELRKAWNSLENDLKWEWVNKALFRHMFDLVTGSAFTRLLTLSARKAGARVRLLSWGSCQTPTLWYVVEREKEVRSFRPKTYYVLELYLDIRGEVHKFTTKPIESLEKAEELRKKLKSLGCGTVKDCTFTAAVEPRPLPLDTDTLVRDVVRIARVSGRSVMSAAEELYAEGYISYPRTETNIWRGVDHREVLQELAKSYLKPYIFTLKVNPRNGRKDDQAHPPIHPTGVYPGGSKLKGLIWDYVARRYLANVIYGDAKLAKWRVVVDFGLLTVEKSGKYVTDEGFYKVFPFFKPREERMPLLFRGEKLKLVKVRKVKKKTKPPPRLAEHELLKLMESNGIGTDATRHEYPSIILQRGYAKKERSRFRPTELGMKLVEVLESVDSSLVTPETRRRVEELMKKVERREASVEEALKEALSIYKRLFQELSEKEQTVAEELARAIKKDLEPSSSPSQQQSNQS